MKRVSIILGVLLALSLIANVVLLARTTGSGGQSQGSRVSQKIPIPAWHQPGPAFDKPLPPSKQALTHVRPHLGIAHPESSSALDWVYGVRVADLTNYDEGRAINEAAHANGISAPGLLSTLLAECGFYTHSTTCDRYGFWPDVSFGQCQVTVQTAAGFGVGYGNSGSDELVRIYENDVNNCIWLAAKVLGSYKRYLASVGCYVDFPQLYVAWNAGPGNPCWFINSPSGQAGTNYYGNYLGQYRAAMNYATNYDPYGGTIPAPPSPPKKPTPRPVHKNVRFTTSQMNHWCGYLKKRHKPCPSPYYHGQLSVVAASWLWGRTVANHCAGIAGNERWNTHRRVMLTPFKFCSSFSWPWRDRKVKWAKR